MLGRHVYRVKPAADRSWVVNKEGENEARSFPSEQEAIDYATSLATQDQPSKIIVESGSGTISEEKVFGVDPGLLESSAG
jgi:hypothetical protein